MQTEGIVLGLVHQSEADVSPFFTTSMPLIYLNQLSISINFK